MSQHATMEKHATLLEEYAAELTTSAEELAATLGPAGKTNGVHKPRKPAQEVGATSRNLEMVMRIPVTVKVVLGAATMPVANIVSLGRGAIIPLDRKVGEPVDVVVNGRVIARGEVVIVDEASSRFGISLIEIVGPAADKPL